MSEQARAKQLIEESQCIVFICSGNVLRSAFGDIYLRHMQCPGFDKILSCATTYNNSCIYPESEAELLRIGK